MTNNPTILVDSDVLAYAAASSTEVPFEWEPGYFTWYTPFEETKSAVSSAISDIRDEFRTNDVVLCLTDSINFRKSVLPTYKSNRSDKRKPLVLLAIRQWIINELGGLIYPGLEGDDIMGIMATSRDNTIILSPDKDMQQIPGKLCKALGEEIIEISKEEADYYHLYQTLTGDQTDGYAGCPGVGPVKAEKVLKDCYMSGLFETEYAWYSIVSEYEKKGLTEEDALVQARVAKILRAENYDFVTKQPILWQSSTPKPV